MAASNLPDNIKFAWQHQIYLAASNLPGSIKFGWQHQICLAALKMPGSINFVSYHLKPPIPIQAASFYPIQTLFPSLAIPYEVMSNLNVLGPQVIDKILDYTYGTLIVDMDFGVHEIKAIIHHLILYL
ncbi:hypothetical protein Tco_0269310 [Tanacetum coccineum]